MSKYIPYNYQKNAVQHIIKNIAAGLFIDMGLGKTIITLTALQELFDDFAIHKVLVIAPKKVAENTWPDEIRKWDHLNLTWSLISGNEKERLIALSIKADIYIIGVDNLLWLLELKFSFDTVVIDELSKFKSNKAKRFKALRKERPKIKRLIGLTGTPTPNGLMDLWSEIYLLDRGKRLGKTLGGFRNRFFDPDKRNQQIIFSYKPKPEAEQVIHKLVKDICISMTTEDYLELPEKIEIIKNINLPDNIQKLYIDFEEEQVMGLDDEINAVNGGVLVNKLLQFTGGAIYDDEKNVHEIHQEKLDMLDEIIEEANNESVLIFYNYKHELTRIREKYPQAKVLKTSADIVSWNKGEIKILVAHPGSAGHGLNLQSGGRNIIWYGPTYNLEHWLQAIKRLHRLGQTKPVKIYILICQNTIDEDIFRRIQGKIATQDNLIEAVKFRKKFFSLNKST